MPCGEVADRQLRCGRVEKELVLRKLDILLRGVDDALRAALERRFKLHGSADITVQRTADVLVV